MIKVNKNKQEAETDRFGEEKTNEHGRLKNTCNKCNKVYMK